MILFWEVSRISPAYQVQNDRNQTALWYFSDIMFDPVLRMSHRRQCRLCRNWKPGRAHRRYGNIHLEPKNSEKNSKIVLKNFIFRSYIGILMDFSASKRDWNSRHIHLQTQSSINLRVCLVITFSEITSTKLWIASKYIRLLSDTSTQRQKNNPAYRR